VGRLMDRRDGKNEYLGRWIIMSRLRDNIT
jgi:hypothetical protein